jgi:hypothetical protein
MQDLQARGVVPTLDGGELRFRAPKGTLTDEVRDAIRAHKPELLRLVRDQEVAVLRDLATSIGERMQHLAQVLADEWEAFKAALFADDDQLAAGMKRLGLRLEDVGWRLGPGCRWERIAPPTGGTLFREDEAPEVVGAVSP